MRPSIDRSREIHNPVVIERLRLTASDFVQLESRALWLIATNHQAVRRGISSALDAHEYELAALQSRFSIQLGIRIKLALSGFVMEGVGGPFEAAIYYFGRNSQFVEDATALDRRNPMTTEEVIVYAQDCGAFLRQCGANDKTRFMSIDNNQQVNAFLARMRELSELARALGVAVTWPDGDLMLLETMSRKLQPQLLP